MTDVKTIVVKVRRAQKLWQALCYTGCQLRLSRARQSQDKLLIIFVQPNKR